MVENRPNKKRPSEFGSQLKPLGFKYRDIRVFSRMYGMSDPEAAQYLISVSGNDFNGLDISDTYYNERYERRERINRSEAARITFTQYFGEPTVKPLTKKQRKG